MALIRKILKTGKESGHYPFSVPAIKNLENINLNRNMIVFIGENGSGKSTLLEIIAMKLGLQRIGSDSDYSDPEFSDLKKALKSFEIEYSIKPKGFFFRSEDFLSYIRFLNSAKEEAVSELKRIENDYSNKSEYAKALAGMPHKRTLAEIGNMYQRNLHEQSHGESYLDFFKSRLKPNNLYLLDEAEVPLSFQNQLALLVLIKNAAENGSQFIMSTHSPVLMSIPGACIYDFDDGRIKEVRYEDIDAVNQLRDFLNNKERYLRHLFH